MNGALSDYWFWLNYNILKYSEVIIMLKKSLFSHTFFWDWNVSFVLQKWKQFGQ